MKTKLKINPDALPLILAEAEQAAKEASNKYFHDQLGGMDRMLCGFAWINIRGIHGNSKLAKVFAKHGIRKDYSGYLCWWNPASFPCQNIDTLEAGALAAGKVLQKYGIDAIAQSRLD